MSNRPTPDTDSKQLHVEDAWREYQKGEREFRVVVPIEIARNLERQRDEAREALSGRTVSCSQCNEAAQQLEAMRDAIKEAHEALDNCVEFINDAKIIEAQWHWEPVKQAKSALAKLQPFIKS